MTEFKLVKPVIKNNKDFDEWWDDFIVPLNAMMDEAVEVSGSYNDTSFTFDHIYSKEDSHRAYLFDIKALPELNVFEILRDVKKYYEDKGEPLDLYSIHKDIEEVLEKS